MNKARRDALDKIAAKLAEVRGEIEAIRDEEQEAFDAMPESFQNGERGEKTQASIDALDSAVSDLETVESSIEEAQQ